MTPGNVSEAILSAIPLSLRRAMFPVSGIALVGAPLQAPRYSGSRGEIISLQAARWLRASQEEKLKKAGKEGIPFETLSVADRAALGLFMVRHSLTALSGRTFYEPAIKRIQEESYVTIAEDYLYLLKPGDRNEDGTIRGGTGWSLPPGYSL
ncbi:MAG: hypothetical protein OHK0029_01080 [Armatimonadaceae bacterium]